MGLVLHIPDSVARAIRLAEERLEDELLAELAVALHRQNMRAFGKARELASLSHRDFAQVLGKREISRHYGVEDFQDDLAYARGE